MVIPSKLALLKLDSGALVRHGLSKQHEALVQFAANSDYEGTYELYSQAVGYPVLIPAWDGERHHYFLMTRLSEVQWVRREHDEALILWDLTNEVVVVIRLQEGHFVIRVLSSTLESDEGRPVSAA